MTDNGRTAEVAARLLTPDEKLRYADRIRAALAVYDTCAARAQRDIRVFLLTPLPVSANPGRVT